MVTRYGPVIGGEITFRESQIFNTQFYTDTRVKFGILSENILSRCHCEVNISQIIQQVGSNCKFSSAIYY